MRESLKSKKKKSLFRRMRSADVAAELILDQVVAGNDRSRIVAEPAVGHQRRIAMILIDVAVKLVGAGLRHQLELAAAGGAGFDGRPATLP